MRLMRVRDVVQFTGLPRSSLYAMVSQGRFPRPIKLSERTSAWRLDDLEQWVEERTKASRPEMAVA